MAQITLNIPDNVATRVVDAICSQYGYESGNKNAFAKQAIINHVKSLVREHEYRLAEEQAKQTALEAVDNDVTIT